MNDFVIKVENIGKRYRIPSLRRGDSEISRFKAHLKEFLGALAGSKEEDYFWALRDVSFQLKQGEVLGIMGLNGSGKSTLLKILSGVTAPSEGRARLRGRLGTLLEVGTGFHPDMTGRENIFMSGTLLGMKRQEIQSKFDEIVDFSGIEQFIDVPVKRYSSGMYVRLAYSVAAHLDTDILILDEVLAVGDAVFREKSLNNMRRVSEEGRTILFVSHHASAVANLCKTGLVLSEGREVFRGSAKDAVRYYLRDIHQITENETDLEAAPALIGLTDAQRFSADMKVVITSIETLGLDGAPKRVFRTGEGMWVRIGYTINQINPNPYFYLYFQNLDGERVMTLHNSHSSDPFPISGEGFVECVIPELRLVSGQYSLMLEYGISSPRPSTIDCVSNATTVEVVLGDYLSGVGLLPHQGWIAQRSHWLVKQREDKEQVEAAMAELR